MSHRFIYANGKHKTTEGCSHVRINHEEAQKYIDGPKVFDISEYDSSLHTLEKALELIPEDQIIRIDTYDRNDNSAKVLKDYEPELPTPWINLRVIDYLGESYEEAKLKLAELAEAKAKVPEELSSYSVRKNGSMVRFEECAIQDATHFKLHERNLEDYNSNSVMVDDTSIKNFNISEFVDLIFKIHQHNETGTAVQGIDIVDYKRTNWIRKKTLIPLKKGSTPMPQDPLLSTSLLEDHPVKAGDTIKRTSGTSANFPMGFETTATSVHIVDGEVYYSLSANRAGKKVKNSAAKFWEKVTDAHRFGNAQQEPPQNVEIPKSLPVEDVVPPVTVAPIAAAAVAVASEEAIKPTPTQEPKMAQDNAIKDLVDNENIQQLVSETTANMELVAGERLYENIDTAISDFVLGKLTWWQKLTISKKQKELLMLGAIYTLIHAIRTGAFGLFDKKVNHKALDMIALACNYRIQTKVFAGFDTNVVKMLLSAPTLESKD